MAGRVPGRIAFTWRAVLSGLKSVIEQRDFFGS
jgi:hypothetical protein